MPDKIAGMTKKSLFALFGPLLVGACALNSNHLSEADVRTACQATVDGYALTRDREDADGHAALFAPNGTMTLFGETLTGRDAIAEALRRRSNGPTVRHMTTTAEYVVTGPHSASGINYALVLTAENGATPPRIPLSGDSLLAVARYHDTYEIRNGTCLFTSRELFADFFNPK